MIRIGLAKEKIELSSHADQFGSRRRQAPDALESGQQESRSLEHEITVDRINAP